MSEDLNQFSGEGEASGQSPMEDISPQEAGQRPLPVSESIIPEQPLVPPGVGQVSYPPSPEFYAQMPASDPYAAALPAVPVQSMPVFPPPVPGAPPLLPPSAYGYGWSPVAQAQPLPLGQAIRELPRQYKKILFKPGVRSFAEEQVKADWGIIWLQMLFLAALQALISIPLFLAYNQALANSANITGSSADVQVFSSPTLLIAEVILQIILVPLGLLAGVGIQYLAARAFKGLGSFKQQVYNQLLFQVPLGVVSSFVSLILSTFIGRMMANMFSASLANPANPPTLDAPYLLLLLLFDVISLAIGVYTILLSVFSIMAVHRLSGGKAVASVLLPLGVVAVLVVLCICSVSIVALMAGGPVQ